MASRNETALDLMLAFAERTGLSGGGGGRRYLWTDAFAVCNYLGLAHRSRNARCEALALSLVEAVHYVLGRYAPEDTRTGWLSGLPEEQAEAHPTFGGLRIGKATHAELEWDRDGQYFHYLTKWMHALDQTTRATGKPRFAEWARELARTAHRAFVHPEENPTGRRRMYWKLSVDLSRPLVASMGQHDPLDGLVTYAQLEASRHGPGPSLRPALGDFASMIEPGSLVTGDPLGLGGLLCDAYRSAQLDEQRAGIDGLTMVLVEAALVGVRSYAERTDLRLPADERLAFRELGLSIGLAAVQNGSWQHASREVRETADRLARYAALRGEIEAFWLHPAHRRGERWLEHQDINEVMLATSLAPEGFLVIGPTSFQQS